MRSLVRGIVKFFWISACYIRGGVPFVPLLLLLEDHHHRHTFFFVSFLSIERFWFLLVLALIRACSQLFTPAESVDLGG